MVAYHVIDDLCRHVESGAKCLTLRRPRKRHARLGEAIQLYGGDRYHPRKLLEPDPIVTDLRLVVVEAANRPGRGGLLRIRAWTGRPQPALDNTRDDDWPAAAEQLTARALRELIRLDGWIRQSCGPGRTAEGREDAAGRYWLDGLPRRALVMIRWRPPS